MKCSIFIAFLVFFVCVALSTQASLRKPGNRRNIMNHLRRNPQHLRRKRIDGIYPSVNGGGFDYPNGGTINQGVDGGAIYLGGVVNPGGPNIPYNGDDDDDCPYYYAILGLCDSDEYDGDDSGDRK